MAVKPIPDGFHTVTPYLVVKGAAKVIAFLEKACGAETREQMRRPDGTVGHAELKIGDSMIMIAEASEQHPASPCMLYFYVPDCDAWYKRAIAAGAKSVLEPTNMFYGDRNAGVTDESGMQWWFGTHVEDVPADEMQRRAEANFKQQAQKQPQKQPQKH